MLGTFCQNETYIFSPPCSKYVHAPLAEPEFSVFLENCSRQSIEHYEIILP